MSKASEKNRLRGFFFCLSFPHLPSKYCLQVCYNVAMIMRDYFCKKNHCNRARARAMYMVDKELDKKEDVITHLHKHIALLTEEVETLKVATLPPDERIKALEEANIALTSELANVKDTNAVLVSNLWAYQDILQRQ